MDPIIGQKQIAEDNGLYFIDWIIWLSLEKEPLKEMGINGGISPVNPTG